MINPSTLDIDGLPFLSLCEVGRLPVKPGIYLAIDSDDAVQYVGRTIDLRKRWRDHHRFDALLDMGDIRIAYIATDDLTPYAGVEEALIEWFKPPLNVAGNPDAEYKPVVQVQRVKKEPKPKKQVVSVYFPESLIERLKVSAKAKNRSVNNLITVILESELKKLGV